MGFSPREVDAMTQWEFTACMSAWNKANKPAEEEGAAPPMSDDRLAELGIAGLEKVQ
jgi:hypothetical protein